ncbi:MAG: ArsR/SmtB family transcription factor [Bradymonadaceae bacterium]
MAPSNTRSFKNAAYTHLAEVGKALASGTRLEILELLVQAPRTVEVLAGEVDQSVANTSHHLQALKRAQLVKSQRDGLHVLYTIAGEDVAILLAQLQRVASHHVAALERLSRDYFADHDGLEPIHQDVLLERLRDGDVVLVDVRPDHEYSAGHLPGALSIPLSELEERLGELPSGQTIVAYCRGPFCALSADAAHRLRELGYDAHRTDASVASLRLNEGAP